MKLIDIYREQSMFVRRSGVSVVVCERMGTVDMQHNGETFCYLQDHEGTEFIEGARKVWEECQHLGLDDAFAGHAYSYLDLLEG